MVIAQFYRGPYDGKHLLLPTEEPWPRFVIPQFGTIQIEWYYLRSGQLDDEPPTWAYLLDDSFAGLAT